MGMQKQIEDLLQDRVFEIFYWHQSDSQTEFS